jgi:hypothetical protein
VVGMSELNVDFDLARRPSRNGGEYNKLRTRGFRVQRWPSSICSVRRISGVRPVLSLAGSRKGERPCR